MLEKTKNKCYRQNGMGSAAEAGLSGQGELVLLPFQPVHHTSTCSIGT